MIPLHLSLTGFLSYCEPVELDFTGFNVACIAGANGSGKSSLLDAITWVLFGQARKRDDSLIHLRSDIAQVGLVFAYEGNIYRVQRQKERNRTTQLEFQILQDPSGDYRSGTWKTLSERTLRETETRIVATLRLDYETFTNAAFFLQNNADQFTQQRPGDRKRILGNILGLEVWEAYRQQAAENRRAVEGEIAGIEGRLKEIDNELGEESVRVDALERLQQELERLSAQRQQQEENLEALRQVHATLAEQSRAVELLARQMENAERQLTATRARVSERRAERDELAEALSHAEEIEAAYQAWQQAQSELAEWDEVAARFQEQETRRNAPQQEISVAQARLEEEQRSLQAMYKQVEAGRRELEKVQAQLSEAQAELQASEEKLARREELEISLQTARQRQAEARAENPRLRAEMDELKERIDDLTKAEGAACPLCGQALSTAEREQLITSLQAQGTSLGDRYRANTALMRETDALVQEHDKELRVLVSADREARALEQRIVQLTERQDFLQQAEVSWGNERAPRLEEIGRMLTEQTFALEARERLAQINAELKEIGYNAEAHDAVRQAVRAGRQTEERLRALERARAALAPLERELGELEKTLETQTNDLARQRVDYEDSAETLRQSEQKAPDLANAERQILGLKGQENRLRLDVGAARQKVEVLVDLKARRKDLLAARASKSASVAQYRQLERAFGKDGVPALLIEQALPQIESKANDLLERLSDGKMAVKFVTQAAYKDKRRDDLRETLDIQISDNAVVRDYEMFSGGEAFRVNFAIRLALSEVLAQRAGARLQTLVIDEGFGSQDELGRQRLIEAINMVRSDFEKILVITHIDELKNQFPTRIEVEKSIDGSRIQVI